MSKIYIEDSNIGKDLEAFGLNVCNDIYIDDGELEEFMSDIINEIEDMGIFMKLKNLGIHLNITYQLDYGIYKE